MKQHKYIVYYPSCNNKGFGRVIVKSFISLETLRVNAAQWLGYAIEDITVTELKLQLEYGD